MYVIIRYFIEYDINDHTQSQEVFGEFWPAPILRKKGAIHEGLPAHPGDGSTK